MQTFKKIIISSVSFIITLCLLSFYLCNIYFNSESDYFLDRCYRKELAGTLDYFVIGSSEGLCSFIPQIIDSKLNVNSYNLSGSQLSPNGKIKLLNEEIQRNTIKTVIIVTGDDINYNKKEQRSEGELYLIPRLKDSISNIPYFFKNICIKDYFKIYSNFLNNGLSYLTVNQENNNQKKINKNNKGFHEKDTNDIYLSTNEITSSYNTNLNKSGTEYQIDNLSKLITMCSNNNIDVILVTPIYSDAKIWITKNNSQIYDEYLNISEKNHCKYLDFNLLKNRNHYFSDKNSFSDNCHLSSTGAETFTNLFCDIMKRIEAGEDVSDMFYDSYEEAITHFDYYEIYQSLTKGQ